MNAAATGRARGARRVAPGRLGPAADAGDDHLGPVAVLEQRHEVGERAVVGIDVELAAPEAGDAVVEHVARRRRRGAATEARVRDALRLALRRVAGAPALRRLGERRPARAARTSRARRRPPRRAGRRGGEGPRRARCDAGAAEVDTACSRGASRPERAAARDGMARDRAPSCMRARSGARSICDGSGLDVVRRSSGRRARRRTRVLVAGRLRGGGPRAAARRGRLGERPVARRGRRPRPAAPAGASPAPLSRTSAETCSASAKRCSSSAERRRRPASMRLTADWSMPTHLARARWLQPCRSRRRAIWAPGSPDARRASFPSPPPSTLLHHCTPQYARLPASLARLKGLADDVIIAS